MTDYLIDEIKCSICGVPAAFPKAVKEPYTCLQCQNQFPTAELDQVIDEVTSKTAISKTMGWGIVTIKISESEKLLLTAQRLKEVEKAVDTVDLMRDEFQRIAAILYAYNSAEDIEAKTVCKRAIAVIDQNVPVIVQRDRAEQELTTSRELNQKMFESNRIRLLMANHSPDCHCEDCELLTLARSQGFGKEKV